MDFVLKHYIDSGVGKLDPSKLTPLLNLKYQNSLHDAVKDLGAPTYMRKVFDGFQKFLYGPAA